MTVDLKKEALARSPAWRELFSTIHRSPELGCREHDTAALIHIIPNSLITRVENMRAIAVHLNPI